MLVKTQTWYVEIPYEWSNQVKSATSEEISISNIHLTKNPVSGHARGNQMLSPTICSQASSGNHNKWCTVAVKKRCDCLSIGVIILLSWGSIKCNGFIMFKLASNLGITDWCVLSMHYVPTKYTPYKTVSSWPTRHILQQTELWSNHAN